VLPYFSLPNYPIGDGNIRRRKELVAPFDTVKKKYYDLFPDDRQTYLNDYRRGASFSHSLLAFSLCSFLVLAFFLCLCFSGYVAMQLFFFFLSFRFSSSASSASEPHVQMPVSGTVRPSTASSPAWRAA
jgi:hypothetical protein